MFRVLENHNKEKREKIGVKDGFPYFFLYSKTWFINDLISVLVCVQDLLEDKFYKFLLKACMFACLVIEFHGIL